MTDIVFHIPCTRVPGFKIHDTHLIELSAERDRDIHTQLARRLDRDVLQNDMQKVVPLPRHSVRGVACRYKVSRMSGEGEETAGLAGIPLGVMDYIPFGCIRLYCWSDWELESRETYRRKS